MSRHDSARSTVEIVLIVLAAIVLAPVLLMALAVPMFGMWGGMMGGFGGSGVTPMWGFGMALVWLIVLVGIGYVVYRLAVGRSSASPDPALEALRLAYARGELTEEEFEAREARLNQDAPPE